MGNIFGDAVNAVGDGVASAGEAVATGAQELTGSVGDVISSATGGDTRAQAEGKAGAADARMAADQQMASLERQRQGLRVSGSDPAAIKQHDNWDNWDHPRLYAFRDTLKIEQMQESGKAWEDLGSELAEIFADLDRKARDAAGDGMRGQAAEAGMNASRPLQDWGQSFGDSVRMTGLKVQEVGATAEQTKASIQVPSEPSTARTILGAGASAATFGTAGIADAGLRMREREEDTKRARAVAKNVFTPGYDSVDTSTPALPPPKNPLRPPPPPPPPARPNIPSSQNPSVSGQDTGQSQSTPTSSVDSSVTPPVGNVSTPTPSTGTPSPGQVPASPAESGSAWANPAPGQPVGPPSGGYHPGGSPGPGGVVGMAPGAGGAAGSGGVAGGARGAGGLGRARAGSATPPGAGGRAGAGSAGGRVPMAGSSGAGAGGSAGARGMAGAGGMGAGRGQQGEEDEEHDRPSWLEEHDDVFFNDMPKTAPPVFGA